jgi:formaldehyde-activating enzyme involved in methanogenesis
MFVGDACTNCHDRMLAQAIGAPSPGNAPIFVCLRCGLQQTPRSVLSSTLDNKAHTI